MTWLGEQAQVIDQTLQRLSQEHQSVMVAGMNCELLKAFNNECLVDFDLDFEVNFFNNNQLDKPNNFYLFRTWKAFAKSFLVDKEFIGIL